MRKLYSVALIAACAAAASAEQDDTKPKRNKLRGRNRRTGHFYDTDYELASSVMFTRDGERDPGMLIPQLSEPEFQSASQLLT